MTTAQDLKQFAWIMGGMIALLFGLLIPHFRAISPAPITFWIAGCFIFAGLIHPRSLSPVYRLWMQIGHILGTINTRIILGIFFVVFVIPFGVVLRLFGWDAMHRSWSPELSSYRIPSTPLPRQQMEKPF